MTLDLPGPRTGCASASGHWRTSTGALPEAELITDGQRPKLAAFMADVARIEQVGARAFAALARKVDDQVSADLYGYFHAEEQRHANASSL